MKSVRVPDLSGWSLLFPSPSTTTPVPFLKRMHNVDLFMQACAMMHVIKELDKGCYQHQFGLMSSYASIAVPHGWRA